LAALCRCYQGEVWVQLGRMAEGVAQLRQGIDDLLSIEARIGISKIIGYLAIAEDRQGDVADAFDTIERALQASRREVAFRPEILRLRGELRFKHNHIDLAKADFLEALSLARGMLAKAWELRSTMSLSRLLDHQGDRDEARAILSGIYNWFTEGFDTPDLKDAQTLLIELGA